MIFFGAINPCKVNECNRGKFIFDGNTAYRCTGILSEFGNCNTRVKKPERRPIVIPSEYAEFEFLNREFKPHHHRLFKDNPKTASKVFKPFVKPKRVPTTRYRKMLMKSIPSMN